MNRLQLEDNGDETFTLLADVVWFDLVTLSSIRVRRGEITDFASIPRIFWPIIPPYGRHGFAAVIHDYLYRVRGVLIERTLPRTDCDRIFREIMERSDVVAWRRWTMWTAVRVFGWIAWTFGNHDGDPPSDGCHSYA